MGKVVAESRVLMYRICFELSMSKRGSSNKVVIVVPTGSGREASAPKIKRCRMSAVRDFLPGCRRVTAQNFGLSRQTTVDRSSQGLGAWEFLVLYVIRSVKCRKA
ncbi:hypothetical protein PVK06_024108 [Gossypium arboreum]|uniref:Uncharacterized protein n=1 Tax=Gossypium arboreum TaxID=29729 RepID=A0ABR0PD60_GOSAR|nr:hypothetical protein PVK06_024108 [Gossypium arboreum]